MAPFTSINMSLLDLYAMLPMMTLTPLTQKKKKIGYIQKKKNSLGIGYIQLSLLISFKIKGFIIDAISIKKRLYFYLYFF